MSTIGSRIRNRREELGLSQDELGKRLGYKSRSSINKIELDQRNLTQSKIKAIADALDTTLAYIMGWNEPNQKLDAEKLKFFDNLFPIETKRFPLLGGYCLWQTHCCQRRKGTICGSWGRYSG